MSLFAMGVDKSTRI